VQREVLLGDGHLQLPAVEVQRLLRLLGPGRCRAVVVVVIVVIVVVVVASRSGGSVLGSVVTGRLATVPPHTALCPGVAVEAPLDGSHVRETRRREARVRAQVELPPQRLRTSAPPRARPASASS
jgi:hypothetical protein